MALAAPTVLDIWNMAFVQLSLTTVDSTSSPASHAAKARATWPMFRQQFLQSHRWNGVKRTVTLTVDGTAPTARWSYRYDLGQVSNLLLVLFLNGYEMKPGDDWWEIETDSSTDTKYLLTDSSTATVEVLVDVPVESALPKLLGPSACYAMAHAFAACLAPDCGKSPQEQQILDRRADMEVKKAKGIDGQEGTPPMFEDSDLVKVRWY